MKLFFIALGAFILDIIETIVVALAIFVVVYLFLFQPHQVKGSSMLPNFHDGEYILTDKISYRFGLPQIGDVVVFKAPKNQEVDYIKRIIGLPGDEVSLNNGLIFLNGIKLPEKYLSIEFSTSAGSFLQEGVGVVVPKGQYFVLGDNRDHSSDSREWGFITKEEIVGKTFVRYWPINEMGFIPKPDYKETSAR